MNQVLHLISTRDNSSSYVDIILPSSSFRVSYALSQRETGAPWWFAMPASFLSAVFLVAVADGEALGVALGVIFPGWIVAFSRAC